jgi:hypothetical protein
MFKEYQLESTNKHVRIEDIVRKGIYICNVYMYACIHVCIIHPNIHININMYIHTCIYKYM